MQQGLSASENAAEKTTEREGAEWCGGRFAHCKLLFPLSELMSFDPCHLQAASEFGLVFELDPGEPSASLQQHHSQHQ